MAGKLILLPLRVGLGSARLLTRVAGEAASRAVSLAGQAIGAASRERSGEPAPPPPESAPAAVPARPSAPEPQAPTVAAPAAPEPAHVSEEPELVREEAEPGAEDGAGAAVTVLEPWPGYAQMNAAEVIARAGQADPAELAAVRLYEARHQSRQTVLAAVDRQLELGDGPA